MPKLLFAKLIRGNVYRLAHSAKEFPVGKYVDVTLAEAQYLETLADYKNIEGEEEKLRIPLFEIRKVSSESELEHVDGGGLAKPQLLGVTPIEDSPIQLDSEPPAETPQPEAAPPRATTRVTARTVNSEPPTETPSK